MTSEVKNGLAIPLALVGNAINSVGYILQKQAHMNNEIKKDKWIEEQMRKGRKGVIDINGVSDRNAEGGRVCGGACGIVC